MPQNSLDYLTLPLEQFSVRDLTDALGVEKSAELLNTSARVVYTMRNTNRIGADRAMLLITAIRADEPTCRSRLAVVRNMKRLRQESAAA